MKFFHTNICEAVQKNTFYRKVVYTVDGQFQTVYMNIPPQVHIGMEEHDGVQSITVVEGKGKASLDGVIVNLKHGDRLIVPPHTHHDVWNHCRSKDLKIISDYSPPEHPPNRKQKVKPTSPKRGGCSGCTRKSR